MSKIMSFPSKISFSFEMQHSGQMQTITFFSMLSIGGTAQQTTDPSGELCSSVSTPRYAADHRKISSEGSRIPVYSAVNICNEPFQGIETRVKLLHATSCTLTLIVDRVTAESENGRVNYEYLANFWVRLDKYGYSILSARKMVQLFYKSLFIALKSSIPTGSPILSTRVAVITGFHQKVYAGKDLLELIHSALVSISTYLPVIIAYSKVAHGPSIPEHAKAGLAISGKYLEIPAIISREIEDLNRFIGTHRAFNALVNKNPHGGVKVAKPPITGRTPSDTSNRSTNLLTAANPAVSSGDPRYIGAILHTNMEVGTNDGDVESFHMDGMLFGVVASKMFIGYSRVSNKAVFFYLLSVALKYACICINESKILAESLATNVLKVANDPEAPSSSNIKELRYVIVSNLVNMSTGRDVIYSMHNIFNEFVFRRKTNHLVLLSSEHFDFQIKKVALLSYFGVVFMQHLSSPQFFAVEKRDSPEVRRFILTLRAILVFFTLPVDFLEEDCELCRLAPRLGFVLNSFLVASKLGWDSVEYGLFEKSIRIVHILRGVTKIHSPKPALDGFRGRILIYLQDLVCGKVLCKKTPSVKALESMLSWIKSAIQICRKASEVSRGEILALTHKSNSDSRVVSASKVCITRILLRSSKTTIGQRSTFQKIRLFLEYLKEFILQMKVYTEASIKDASIGGMVVEGTGTSSRGERKEVLNPSEGFIVIEDISPEKMDTSGGF